MGEKEERREKEKFHTVPNAYCPGRKRNQKLCYIIIVAYILADSFRLSADGLKYVLLCSTARLLHLLLY